MGMFDFNPDRAHGSHQLYCRFDHAAKVLGDFGGHSIPSSLAHRHQNLSGAGGAFLSSQLAPKAGRGYDIAGHSRVQSSTMVNIRVPFPLLTHSLKKSIDQRWLASLGAR